MSQTEETHEIDITDTQLSKYETMLYLVSGGYIVATGLIVLDAVMFMIDPSKTVTIIDAALGTAWLGWTAGLFGWLHGKNQ